MTRLIDRYLDGELSDEEARSFLAELEGDPALAAELQDYEEVLAELARTGSGEPSPDFTARVMADVHALASHVQPRRQVVSLPARRRWPRALALAASLAVVFGLGWLAARVGPGVLQGTAGSGRDLAAGGQGPGGAPVAFVPADAAQFAGGSAGLRLVRLVYVPPAGEVGQVSVAGTFNDWDPRRTPMEKHDGAWTALLLLPADTYEYMFVEDGRTWRTDPLALQTRDDGFGRQNAVLDLTL